MKVLIKTWDKMETEFGLNSDKNIRCKKIFMKEMEDCLPTDRIIHVNEKLHWKFNEKLYKISNDMIETSPIEKEIKTKEI